MRKTLLSVFALCSMTAFSQNLDKEVLTEIENSVKKDNYLKASMNAVRNNSIKSVAFNHDNENKLNHNFKYQLGVNDITNQYKSGRCWMFTSMNVLRPKMKSKYEMGEFMFSHNYLYFYDIFEKSNLFLENIIATVDKAWDDRKVEFYLGTPVGDGGVWNSFTNLVEKYGLVPKSAMHETNTSNNTGQMRFVLNKILRQAAYKIRTNKSQAKELKMKALKDVYRLLVINLGFPPKTFDWEYKNKDGDIKVIKDLTPLKFAKLFGNNDYSNYVMLMDDPTREYGKLYEIESDRNVMEGRNWTYINLPAEKIKKYALKSLQDDQAMYFSCDVGKQMDRDNGYLALNNFDYEALFGIDMSSSKKARVLTKQSGSSHGMNLMGVDVDENGKITQWKLENSWGSNSGHKGFLTMTDEWFDQYMFRVVILDKYIDKDVLEILEQKPTMLKPWDPMFRSDD